MAGQTKSRGYVREWMESVQLKQADLVKRLGWSKAKANAVWHAEQRLNEDILEEVAPLVNAQPFELLLHPATAYQIRRLEAAFQSVREPEPQAPAPAAIPLRRRG